jgi:hypothetical protein
MTDKELLELAAKAAGLKIDKSTTNGGGLYNTGFDIMGSAVLDWHNGTKWNPLTDDGDALRLAVKLNLQITPGTYNKEEATAYGSTEAHERVHYQQDIYAATRRAIVRAAAEIGKGM